MSCHVMMSWLMYDNASLHQTIRTQANTQHPSQRPKRQQLEAISAHFECCDSLGSGTSIINAIFVIKIAPSWRSRETYFASKWTNHRNAGEIKDEQPEKRKRVCKPLSLICVGHVRSVVLVFVRDRAVFIPWAIRMLENRFSIRPLFDITIFPDVIDSLNARVRHEECPHPSR